MNVLLLGPVPTPAWASSPPRCAPMWGIMISASHNPAHDNGIKFFGPDGFKLSDEAEAEIEALVEQGVEPAQAATSAAPSASTTAASATWSGSRAPSPRAAASTGSRS
jgi:phosphomannomutase